MEGSVRTLLLILLAVPSFAAGPKYGFTDPKLDDEFVNVYHDISYPKIIDGKANKLTVTNLTVSTATISNLRGVSSASNACPGCIGEYVEGIVSLATIPGVSGVPTSVSTITLTAGDWDVSALGFFAHQGGSSISNAEISINTTANADGTLGNNAIRIARTATTTDETALAIPTVRVSVSATTPVYLVVDVTFTVATPRFAGNIRARRVR